MAKMGTWPRVCRRRVYARAFHQEFCGVPGWGISTAVTLLAGGGGNGPWFPKHSVGCGSISSPTAGSEAPTGVLPRRSASSDGSGHAAPETRLVPPPAGRLSPMTLVFDTGSSVTHQGLCPRDE